MRTNIEKQLDNVLSRYGKDRNNLLPILEEVQQGFGYLSEEAMNRVAKFLKLSNSTVYSVATFYTHLRLTPPGKNMIKVCCGPACHLQASAAISEEVVKQLGIKPGETTGDLRYSLEATACSGACSLAPVIEIDGMVYGQMTKAKLKNILAKKRPH